MEIKIKAELDLLAALEAAEEADGGPVSWERLVDFLPATLELVWADAWSSLERRELVDRNRVYTRESATVVHFLPDRDAAHAYTATALLKEARRKRRGRANSALSG